MATAGAGDMAGSSESYLLSSYDHGCWADAHPGGEPITWPHVLAHRRAAFWYTTTYALSEPPNPYLLAHPAIDSTIGPYAGAHGHPRP